MKLSNLFRRKPSREVAKDRLKILLISDRVNCSPEILEMIKKDIAEVISRYMKIDTNNMEIHTHNHCHGCERENGSGGQGEQ